MNIMLGPDSFRSLIRYSPVCLLVFVCQLTIVASVSAQDSSDTPAAQLESQQEKLTSAQARAVQLPDETESPIFIYDLTGGFRLAVPNQLNPIPKFQLFADGRVIAKGGNPPLGTLDIKLSAAELTEFLGFVVNENRFSEIDMVDVKKQMNAGPQFPKMMDAPTARFFLRLKNVGNEVSLYDLHSAIRRFPKLDAIQQLARIEHRCNLIVSKVHLADDGPYVLKFVNDLIAKEKPGIEPVTMKELRLATRFADGKFQVSFERVLPKHDGGPGRKANIIFYRRSNDIAPVVKFYGFPDK